MVSPTILVSNQPAISQAEQTRRVHLGILIKKERRKGRSEGGRTEGKKEGSKGEGRSLWRCLLFSMIKEFDTEF